MFKINGKEIKYKRSLTKLLSDNNIDIPKCTLEDLDSFCDIIKLDRSFSYDIRIKTLVLLANPNVESSKVYRFIATTGLRYNPDLIIDYLEFKKTNLSDSNSDTFYKLKYGNKWKEVRDNKKDKKSSIYDPVYVASKENITLEEAKAFIKDYKSKKATSKKGFIERWGEEEGVKKFEEFKETSKHTEKKYTTKYGKEEGLKKWKEYVYIKRETSVFTINHWVNKGHTLEDAEELRAKFHKENLNTSSVTFWISKGLSKKEAKNKVIEIFEKKNNDFITASKESLNYFEILGDKLKEKNISFLLGGRR